ncbi:uracil-xanthine permease family protein [Methanobacterium sp. ACI-7]|uniref:uracil-xanthine permease family protein n=1 Tax=unclassified Methanobacterium TaxID=2627676 RepID=UPI0039C45F58
MYIKYGLDDKPKRKEMLLFGLQWFAVTIPSIIIIGKLVGVLETGGNYIPYLQKLFLIVGILMIVQIYWGHRLPLILGPAAVLLIAIITSFDQGAGSINSSLIIGGLLLAVLAASGLFKYLKKLFTPRVIMVILMLISFTLAPTIINLISAGEQVPSTYNLIFSFAFIFVIFVANAFLKGLWRSTLTLSSLIGGTVAYYLIFRTSNPVDMNLSVLAFPSNLLGVLTVPDIGVLIAFLISFIALAINDLGSIQSVGTILRVDDLEKRVSRGITFTGIGNMFAGFFGVIGYVNYTLSPGVIAATGVASRFTLIPAAIVLLILGFSPLAINLISSIPAPVIGVILLYVLISQIGAALLVAIESNAIKTVDEGMIIGLPILLGTVIAFLPINVALELPSFIRPLIANGFVVGVIFVLLLEHVLYPRHSLFNED